jgi:GNAT superfamily N-acetyltransferase
MGKKITIREFTAGDSAVVYSLIQKTIEISYPEIYPPEAVKAFKDYHSEKNLLNDAAAGYTVVAGEDDEIVGTGTLFGEDMRRVYIHPDYQSRGIGRLVALELEKKAVAAGVPAITLAATVKSKKFWESLGFVLDKEDFMPVDNGVKLYFYRMSKKLA